MTLPFGTQPNALRIFKSGRSPSPEHCEDGTGGGGSALEHVPRNPIAESIKSDWADVACFRQ
jgi:hypothetical protein